MKQTARAAGRESRWRSTPTREPRGVPHVTPEAELQKEHRSYAFEAILLSHYGEKQTSK